MIRFPLDRSGQRISQPARRLSEVDIRHPEGINRMSYDWARRVVRPRITGGSRVPLRGPGMTVAVHCDAVAFSKNRISASRSSALLIVCSGMRVPGV